MNKSILKHEIRSMKWMLLLSVLISLYLIMMFSMSLDGEYAAKFNNGIYGNEALIQSSLRYISDMTFVLFTMLSAVQIFMQFKSEKDQEVGRFLKSLPVKKEEFFKIKLITGIINLTVAFIVLTVGIIIVRNNNMFWIKDIYSISAMAEPFIVADGVVSLSKEIGLIYLVVLSFYCFLFMVQYTFTNVIGGIVTGVLVWLGPVFIVFASLYTLDFFFHSPVFRHIEDFAVWLFPWSYPFEHIYSTILMSGDRVLGRISTIEHLEIKYIISFVLIIVNILIAYNFNKSSKVENENKVIVFKSTGNIFKLGVTICSGLLVSTVLSGILMIRIHGLIYILLILLGGFIGYLISNKITQVGTR